ncbi:MAG: glycosyl hydrolase [Bacteroidales bacterium]
MKTHFKILFGSVLLIMLGCFAGCSVNGDKDGKDLEAGFLNPPDSARPRVWWHWMNGNITKQGIRADLEWMHRIGIRGFQNFDAALMTPQIVEKRLVYMTPGWKEAFSFTTRLADSLGLEMAIAGSPGWSESGGPWVSPGQAMKKYVWTEISVEGGKTFKGKLPEPASTTGSFGNLPARDGFSLSGAPGNEQPGFYADAAVVAYKVPANDLSMEELNPVVTSSGGKFSLASLTDGDLAASTLLPYAKPGEKAWIMYSFDKQVTVNALTIVGGGFAGTFGFGADADPRTLEAGDDGVTFTRVTDIPIGGVEQKTLSFAPVTARFFRFTWLSPAARSSFNLGAALGLGDMANSSAPKGIQVAELVLHTVPVINRLEEKAAFATATDLYQSATPDTRDEDAVRKSEVIDLTNLMKPDGTIEWNVPDGKWRIIRLGYSLTGHKNSPASPEATGLEVDKLNASHVKAYFTNYLDQYKDATEGLMGKRGLGFMITDSWEAGAQNWTDNMITEFRDRRGYDMLQYIPVLAGHIVESSKESESFLWDFRKTLADLVTANHYDQLTEILKERGMKRYSESHESGRAFIGDGMEAKRGAAVPMSATWTPGGLDPGTEVATRYKADVRESASVSHIYGQSFVAAESLTAIGSAWAWSPGFLKPTADMELANGLNRFVIHTSVHQPVNDKIPGLGLGPFGQWFTRHETWAEQATAWIDYLSRSCFMLQQGKFVADVAYFYGEDNNITALFGNELPPVPDGYNYDFVNADALVNALETVRGNIITPAGTSYRLLALDPNSRYMSLKVLKAIKELVIRGATVSGNKPLGSPSLSDNPDEFKSIADELWKSEKGVNLAGKGKVLAGMSVPEALKQLAVIPDFDYTSSVTGARLLYVHRTLGSTQIYWVNSRSGEPLKVETSYRVTGLLPEIWHPETGRIEKVSYTIKDDVTTIPLELDPNDAVFVVFRQKATEKSVVLPEIVEKELATIEGPWTVNFQEGRGAPSQQTFDKLSAWQTSEDNGIKYFSGTASYTRAIQAPDEWIAHENIWIDLGEVGNLAEVFINGKSLGITWKKPFRVNVTGELKKGDNSLEVRVTNLWVNRLIGDAQPGVKSRLTYTTMPFYNARSPLMNSGLLGPVRIVAGDEVEQGVRKK